jgi:Family of unknown function (DUF5397)
MQTNTHSAPSSTPSQLVGVIKTFGERGPMYEVLGPAPRSERGEMVAIRVVLSGEELNYPLADMLADPVVP